MLALLCTHHKVTVKKLMIRRVLPTPVPCCCALFVFESNPVQTQSGVTFKGPRFEEEPTALQAVKEPPASPHLPFCEGLVNKNSRVPASARPCPVATVQRSKPSKSPPNFGSCNRQKRGYKEGELFSFQCLPSAKSGVSPLILLGVMTHNGCGQCVPKDIFSTV